MRVDNIKHGNYEGYLWYSDAIEPELFNNNKYPDLEIRNPFIIEGFLFDKNQGLSYSIKFTDGQYIVNEYHPREDDENNPDVEIKEFYTHRIKGHKKIKFLQYWRAEKDEFCMDKDVLQPQEMVFVGFID